MFIVTSAALGIATLPFQSALMLMLSVLIVPIIAGLLLAGTGGDAPFPQGVKSC